MLQANFAIVTDTNLNQHFRFPFQTVRRKRQNFTIVGFDQIMIRNFQEPPKLQTYLSENLQICASVSSQSRQAQVTLTREYPSLVPAPVQEAPDLLQRPFKRYSTVLKRNVQSSVVLTPEEFDNFRFFLPVFDNFYSYQLYVYNKPSTRRDADKQLGGAMDNSNRSSAGLASAANPCQ